MRSYKFHQISFNNFLCLTLPNQKKTSQKQKMIIINPQIPECNTDEEADQLGTSCCCQSGRLPWSPGKKKILVYQFHLTTKLPNCHANELKILEDLPSLLVWLVFTPHPLELFALCSEWWFPFIFGGDCLFRFHLKWSPILMFVKLHQMITNYIFWCVYECVDAN